MMLVKFTSESLLVVQSSEEMTSTDPYKLFTIERDGKSLKLKNK